MPSGIFRLDTNTNISSLEENTGTRTLAMTGPGNVFGNATKFLRNVRQLQPNSLISVVDGPGTSTSVIFILNASAGVVGFVAGRAATKVGGGAARKGATRKAASKSARKATRKPAKKATKSTKSKTAKKRSTGKAGKKRGTKKSTKKSSRK